MIGAQRRAQFLDHAIVDQHCTQESRFGFDIGWQAPPAGFARILSDNHIGIWHAALLRISVEPAQGQMLAKLTQQLVDSGDG
jgi:hypothetical protein